MSGWKPREVVRRHKDLPERYDGQRVEARCEFYVSHPRAGLGHDCGDQAVDFVLARPLGSSELHYGTEWRPFSFCYVHRDRLVPDLEANGMEVMGRPEPARSKPA
jgi:hypothetical protein